MNTNITFLCGDVASRQRCIDVTIINDNLVEGNEDFMIITPAFMLFTITNSQTTVTIIDNNSEFNSIM